MYSSILQNVTLFLSIISSDWEVLEVCNCICMYIFTTDRLLSSSKGGITDKNIHTQCISL